MRKTKELKQYETYLYRRELAEGTREIYTRQVSELLKFLNGGKITKEAMIAYKESLEKKQFAVSTQNLYITAVNSYLKFVGYEHFMLHTKRVQKHRSLVNIMEAEEYGRLLAYARKSGREKYYYIMKTLALTGIRISELKYFTVDTLKQEMFVVQNKGKHREIYLPQKLLAELEDYCKQAQVEEGVIFLGSTGKPIGRISVYKTLVRMAEQAGIPGKKAHPHSFRHLFAVTFMRQYGDIAELSDILGHSSLETTRIYTTTTIREKRRKLNELEL